MQNGLVMIKGGSSGAGSPEGQQGAGAAVNRVLARPCDLGNGLEGGLAILALGAFVISALGRIGADHQEILTRREALMAGAGGQDCDVSGFDREEGCVVTGGYVYRGHDIPSLAGIYLFADYCGGSVWGLARDPAGDWVRSGPVETGLRISSFGEDAAGELYMVDLDGAIYRLVAPAGES